MDGLEYGDDQGDDDREEESMLDAQGRRVSEPSQKRARLEPQRDADRDIYRQHSSTYPPPMSRSLREQGGTMGPPQTVLP